MIETWKSIKGYGDLYSVSNLGRVGSNKTGRILRQCIHKKGYYVVGLYKNGEAKSFKVHRLLLQHFVGNPDNKPFCNHRDGNKLNNSLDNIEWCTCIENNRHATENNLGAANKYIIIYPDGKEEEIINLSRFCKEKGLDVSNMVKIANGNGRIRREKGFKCKRTDRKIFVYKNIIKTKIQDNTYGLLVY